MKGTSRFRSSSSFQVRVVKSVGPKKLTTARTVLAWSALPPVPSKPSSLVVAPRGQGGGEETGGRGARRKADDADALGVDFVFLGFGAEPAHRRLAVLDLGRELR